MAKNPKYRCGGPIESLDELAKQDFVYFQGKLYHKGWFSSWQLMWVATKIRRGELFYAVKEE